MEKLDAMFSGTDVYIDGKYHYHTNEILTSYLNISETEMEQAEKNYKHLRYLYYKLRLEEHMDYDKSALFTKYAYETVTIMRQIDSLRCKLPPYNKTRGRFSPHENVIQDLIDHHYAAFRTSNKTSIEVIGRYADEYNPYHFREQLGSEFIRLLNKNKGAYLALDEMGRSYPENVEQLRFVFPEKMEGIVFDAEEWTEEDLETRNTSRKARSAVAFNEDLKSLFEDYIPFLRAVLRVKYVYASFLKNHVHIRHAFLSEEETAGQYDAALKKMTMHNRSYERFLDTEQFSMTYATTKGENNEALLCEKYDFQDLSALLYFDFFKGLKNHYLPQKCNGCGKWFLLKHGQYTYYCDQPSPEHPEKSCREAGVRKKYEDKCKTDPVWRTYNRAYKAHYARYMKKKMTQREFEEWGTFAIKLRDKAASGQMDFEKYAAKIRV